MPSRLPPGKQLPPRSRLVEEDYRKFEIKPQLLKKRVSQRLLSQLPKVGDPYPQIKASRILIKDEATAKSILEQLKAAPNDQLEAKLGQLVREKSEDKASASHNGDLGWFIEGMVEDPIFQEVTKLDLGQLSDPPVKSDTGFNILLVTGKDNNRALDAVEYNQLATTDQNGDYLVFTKWLKKQVEATKPKYNTPPTPTPVPTQVPAPVFTPVIPPTVTSTPIPTTAPAITTAGAAGSPGVTASSLTASPVSSSPEATATGSPGSTTGSPGGTSTP